MKATITKPGETYTLKNEAGDMKMKMPMGLVMDLLNALSEGGLALCDDGVDELDAASLADLARQLLGAHPEAQVGRWVLGELERVEGGEYHEEK
jgi:hypothetical protein